MFDFLTVRIAVKKLDERIKMSKRGENIYKRKDGRWEGRYIRNRRLDGSIHYGYVYASTYKEVKHKLIPLKLKQEKKMLVDFLKEVIKASAPG